MAIIRIKRTTGNALPTGLTFGEMAFIGATGGATASRLYIAGPEGVCVWIGAEILNSPTFWSGSTAETTLPTVSAVESRITSRLSSGTVTSFNNQTGAVQGVSAMGATATSWTKLAVSFTGAYYTPGATGFVNIIGATWADSTTTSSAVGGLLSGTNISGKTVFEILQQMLYVYQSVTLTTVSFSGFSTTSGNNCELGQTLATVSSTTNITTSGTNQTNINADNGFGVTYATSNTSAPAGSCASGFILGYTAWGSPKNNITLPTSFRATTIGANATFRASAAQYTAWLAFGGPGNASGATANSNTTTYTWYPRFYWGKSTTDGLTDPSLLTVGGSGLNASSSGFSPNTFAIDTGNTTTAYLYLFIHNSYTPGQIRVDSSTGQLLGLKNLTQTGTSIIGTIPTATVTNAHGHSATYKIYQSANQLSTAYTLWVGA